MTREISQPSRFTFPADEAEPVANLTMHSREESDAKLRRSEKPTFDHGTPPVDADLLSQANADHSEPTSPSHVQPAISVTSQRRKKKRGCMTGIFMLGHILASILGLAIGYYLLVSIRPEANFLNLELPGLPLAGPDDATGGTPNPKAIDPAGI